MEQDPQPYLLGYARVSTDDLADGLAAART